MSSESNLRVAYVTMQFPTSVETFATGDVRAVKAKGVDISVYCMRGEVSEAAQLTRKRDLADVPVDHAEGFALGGLIDGLKNPLLLVKFLAWIIMANFKNPAHLVTSWVLAPRALQIAARLRADKPDVVHIYWGHLPSLVGYLVQETMPDVATSISLAAYDLRMEYGGSRRVARRADAVRTLCEANVEHIAKAFDVDPADITVIFDGVDLDTVSVDPPPRDSTRIITAGRLLRPKNMHSVLETFALVVRAHPTATLCVLGDGPERDALEKQAADLGITSSVEFTGLVNHAEVFNALESSGIFLFLSDSGSERLPNVVEEAMLCGAVTVASDTIGIRELLPSDDVGFVVGAYDVAAAAAAVNAIIADPEAADRRRVEADNFVRGHFARSVLIDRYVGMWSAARDKAALRKAV